MSVDRAVMESILNQINEAGGEGITLPTGMFIPKPDGEPVMRFAKRIAGGNYEIPTSETVEVPSESPSDRFNRLLDEQAASAFPVQEDVQVPQAGVDESIESEVADIRRSVKRWEGAVDRATGELRNAERKLAFYRRILDAAVPPTIHKEAGVSILREESEGPERGDYVGESPYPDDTNTSP